MKIIVGSTSEHKLGAVREACEKLGIAAEVSGIKTSSDVNEQPCGMRETILGAHTRAMNACEKLDDESVFYVGIENGIITERTRLVDANAVIDFAAVVIIPGSGNRRVIATSAGIEFPMEDYLEAYNRGFETTTIGSIIAEKTGCDAADPHSYLTHGKVSRKDILVQALMIALSQL